jgi:hypothetical protein
LQLRADTDTLPRHPGVDLQMNPQPSVFAMSLNGSDQPLQLLLIPHHRDQPMLHDGICIFRQQAGHHQNVWLFRGGDSSRCQSLTHYGRLFCIRHA